jgi:hypothetical protein
MDIGSLFLGVASATGLAEFEFSSLLTDLGWQANIKIRARMIAEVVENSVRFVIDPFFAIVSDAKT